MAMWGLELPRRTNPKIINKQKESIKKALVIVIEEGY